MFASRPRFSTRTLASSNLSTLSKPAKKAVPRYRGWRHHAIYVDRGVLVLNKPSGLASQPAPSSPKGTHTKSRATVRDTVRPILERFVDAESGRLPWPCHRLDKRTTGVLLCAKNPSLQRDLHAQFASGDIERRYLAILRGGAKTFQTLPSSSSSSSRSRMELPSLSESGWTTIRTLLETRDGSVSVPKDPSCPSPDSESSQMGETRLRVLASSPIAPVSLVELDARTGRRHQLRVHAAHIGAPILGDGRYASATLPPQIADVVAAVDQDPEQEKMYLHAAYIEFFRYRRTGPQRRFRLGIVAPLPPLFVAMCRAFELPVREEYIRGGVYVDGVCVGEEGAVVDLEGRWLRAA